jgi:ribosomal protein S6--L-glutamate ligase
MNLLILGSSKAKESTLIYKEAKRRNHRVYKYNLDDIILDLKKNAISIKLGKHNIDFFDAIVFRGISKNIYLAHLIALYFSKTRKGFVLDKQLVHGKTAGEKLITHLKLLSNDLHCPETSFSINNQLIKKKRFSLPIIAKDVDGRQGKNIYLLKSKAALNSFLSKTDVGGYLFQETLSAREDIRVIVIGNQVIGAMKRIAPKGDFRSNIATGGRSENYSPISDEIRRAAIKAAKIMDIDFAGVDIMINNGKPYILEVNRTPQFKAFLKTTGINPAKPLISFIEKHCKAPKAY